MNRIPENSEQTKFQRRVKVTDDGCWEWQGHILHNGYGQASVGGKLFRAHRLSFSLFCGDIPEGILVLHKCDNRKCVRPDHLFLGSHSDNMQDCVAKGRIARSIGESNPAAKLTYSQVHGIKVRALAGEPVRYIAEEFGVSQSLVRQIRSGKKWGHVK